MKSLVGMCIVVFTYFGVSVGHTPITSRDLQIVKCDIVLDVDAPGLTCAQAKISYCGPQTRPVNNVMFSTKDFILEEPLFASFQSAKRYYINDDFESNKFTVTPKEFKTIISGVKPVVTRKLARTERPFLAFVVLLKKDDVLVGNEYILSESSSELFYSEMLKAIDKSNQDAKRILLRQFHLVVSRDQRKIIKE